MSKLFEGSITHVHGIRVGNVDDPAARTGVTVILARGEGAVGGVDVRGAAPGTRETDLLRPGNLVEKVNAVVLSGGSAFGLASACGVVKYLEKEGIGLDMGYLRVPIVPAAVLFDLNVGNANVRPDEKMGMLACQKASKETAQGRVGAGCGATVGKLVPGTEPMNGGLGTASITLPSGVTVGALAAVNAVGDIYHPLSGKLLACGVMDDGTMVEAAGLIYGSAPGKAEIRKLAPAYNTTLAVIATDAVISKEQANRLATIAHDGFARVIRPVHTQMDGDVIFTLSTGRLDVDANFITLCAAAAEVTARAVYNGVLAGNIS